MEKNFIWAIIFVLGVGVVASVAVKSKIKANAGPTEEFKWERSPSPSPKPQKEEALPAVPTSYEQALLIAKKQKKDVLLFFSADWCKYCKEMKRDTLTDSGVKSTMDKFVFYVVDADKEKALSRKFGVKEIPVYIILDAETEKAKRTGQGYKNANSFDRWLKGQSSPRQPRSM